MLFKTLMFARHKQKVLYNVFANTQIKNDSTLAFADLFRRTTGNTLSSAFISNLKKKEPALFNLESHQLYYTLQLLNKFSITELDACLHPHVFCMHPITMDNYGEVLKECGFIDITPKHIIRYHTLVKSRTISALKKEGLMKKNFELESTLLESFEEWPVSLKSPQNFHEGQTSILTVRMSVLERYLIWKLAVTSEDFQKYCKHYLPLKHKPMCDIRESLKIAENNIKFSTKDIKRNGFIIAADPLHTNLILDNVPKLAGLDIRDVLKKEPAILKNNHISILQVRDILEEYKIPVEAQRRCLKVYCMQPSTVRERLEELRNFKEYKVLFTNPRVLTMVIHKKKMMTRLQKMQDAKKNCYSLNHLVSSSKVFNNYISSFGSKVCGRDIATLISTSLNSNGLDGDTLAKNSNKVRHLLRELKKHKYWLHAALEVIDENIHYLKRRFDEDVIWKNCQLLLYPHSEIDHYINFLVRKRNNENVSGECNIDHDVNYIALNYTSITDEQILSLALYEIEKKYHFSGDGIWAHASDKQDVQTAS